MLNQARCEQPSVGNKQWQVKASIHSPTFSLPDRVTLVRRGVELGGGGGSRDDASPLLQCVRLLSLLLSYICGRGGEGGWVWGKVETVIE